ncbi:MAG: hypothetical protein ACE5LU_14175 [Anaerolineae bacterium]
MMTRWWEPLTGDPVRWLLEGDDPSILYFFLSDVLERPNHSLALRDARLRIPTSPAVRTIFSRQHPDGWWETSDHLTEPAFTATLWQLYLLAELGMTGQDFRVATAADFVLETFMTPGGDFMLTPDGPVAHHWAPGLLLWSLHRLGYAEDERIRRASDRMTAVALVSDWVGRDAEGRSPLWVSLGTLWAMSAIPVQYRSPDMQAAIRQGADVFLQHALMTPPASALRLSFPNYDPRDMLFAMRVLADLGLGADPRVRSAMESVLQRQMDGGRWPLERAFQNAGLDWGQPGRANRWITLNVLRVLKRLCD